MKYGKAIVRLLQNNISEVLSHLPIPYKFGGTSYAGFDCSGLIYYLLLRSGINLPARFGFGSSIPLVDIPDYGWGEAAELLQFGHTSDHIALVIGPNYFLESTSYRELFSAPYDAEEMLQLVFNNTRSDGTLQLTNLAALLSDILSTGWLMSSTTWKSQYNSKDHITSMEDTRQIPSVTRGGYHQDKLKTNMINSMSKHILAAKLIVAIAKNVFIGDTELTRPLYEMLINGTAFDYGISHYSIDPHLQNYLNGGVLRLLGFNSHVGDLIENIYDKIVPKESATQFSQWISDLITPPEGASPVTVTYPSAAEIQADFLHSIGVSSSDGVRTTYELNPWSSTGSYARGYQRKYLKYDESYLNKGLLDSFMFTSYQDVTTRTPYHTVRGNL